MATFISLVRGDAGSGYTASVPDISGFSVQATTLDHVLAKVREGLAAHIERLLETNVPVSAPTSVDAINPDRASLVFAVEIPDDIGAVQVDLAIPALALARIDSFANRRGLTRASLFVGAVDRWIVQESSPRPGGRERSTDATLFDFMTPPELKMGSAATNIDRTGETAIERSPLGRDEDTDIERSVDNITQELERLLEAGAHSQPDSGGAKTN